MWEVDGDRYSRLEFNSTVIVRFECTKQAIRRECGPYNKLLDRQLGGWFSYDAGRHWPAMVVMEAE